MNNIKSYEDLIHERARLQALLVVQRQQVINNWNDVKIELEPVNNAFDVIGKMTHSDKTNPLLNMGLKFASELFLKNFVFARAGWVTRMAVPFVMKNYSSHFISENGKGLINKIKGLGSFFTSHKNKKRGQPE